MYVGAPSRFFTSFEEGIFCGWHLTKHFAGHNFDDTFYEKCFKILYTQDLVCCVLLIVLRYIWRGINLRQLHFIMINLNIIFRTIIRSSGSSLPPYVSWGSPQDVWQNLEERASKFAQKILLGNVFPGKFCYTICICFTMIFL